MNSLSPVTLVSHCRSEFSDRGEPSVLKQSVHVRNVVLGLPLLVCTSFQHKFPTLLCAKKQSYPTKRQKDNIQNRAFHWEKITFTVAFFIFVLHSFPLSFFFFLFFFFGGGGEGSRGSSQFIWDTRRVGTQNL